MARQTSGLEFSNFVAGLVTEASPMNFPANASLDEQNFVLNKDGSRHRRLGLDFESNSIQITTGVSVPANNSVEVNTYRWSNAGGSPDKTLVVVQVGNEIRVFDADITPLSHGLIYTTTLVQAGQSTPFSFAVVDGVLVVAAGIPEIYLFEYDGTVINSSTVRLLVRDLFGVGDTLDGVDLRSGSGISVRPTSMTNTHAYNLRNQTWGEPRDVGKSSLYDTITAFYLDQGENVYPSNADVTTYSIYPNTAAGGVVDEFWPKNAKQTLVGTTPAPRGYFIIDALSRGASRVSEYAKLLDKDSRLNYPVTSLSNDYTPGGATCVSEYAGRVFYSGFSGEIVDGDAHSPRMSSYLLFSKLVEDSTDLNKCYQVGDPTSKEAPDLLDTDGGFIRIDGAYGIKRLINLGDGLVVVASNGVWIVQGGSDYGFTASNYRVTKITNYGCDNQGSIVQVDTSVMYWSTDGIYNVAKNQFGDYVADSMTQATIQTFYNNIDPDDKIGCKAVYDSYERKVNWIYKNRVGSGSGVKKLIFDITLGAFYPYVINSPDGKYPMLIAGVTIPPYRNTLVVDDVEVNGVQVTASDDPVVVSSTVRQSTTVEVVYLALSAVSPVVKFSFCKYQDADFKDWASSDGVGVDAKAYLLTGWLSGGDTQRYKQVPYVTFHFIKTENGFVETLGGDWDLANKSSCLVSSQWEWSNHINSGRWGRPFQAYRIKRQHFPEALESGFDNGFYTVISKSKLRGKGKALSLLIETEDGKDCKLLGWSMIIGANSNV